MAEHKVQGGNMLLFIDPNGGTDYDMVVCLTSVGTSMSVGTVDASSACGPDKSPGALEISYSFEGQHLQDPDSGKISGTNLRLLLNAEQTIGWKMSPETPEDGDEIQSGTGFLSELSSTYQFDSIGTFTGSINPFGQPTITIYDSTLLVVGQAYQGGTIAYLNGTNDHGIIVAWTNDSNSQYWGDSSFYGATVDTLYGGLANTDLIAAAHNPVFGTTAGYLTRQMTQGGYTDWCLPTNQDWLAISPNCTTLGITVGNLYWTCLQPDANDAFMFNTLFNDLTAIPQGGLGLYIAVRYF